MRPRRGLCGRLRSAGWVVWVALAVGFLSANAQTFPYVVEDLGSLPGETDCIPFAINAQGQVVGWSGCCPTRAFVFTDGVGMVELFGLPDHTYTIARGINDAGVIVGEAWGGGLPCHALRWTGGVPEDLGALRGTSRAWDVSPSGDVIGETPIDALDSEAFLHTSDDGMTLLMPERYASHAMDINEVGQIAGQMTVGNSWHPYRFTPGAGVEDLGTLPDFPHAGGNSINVSGQVAGGMSSATGNSARIFRFTDGIGMVNLGGVGEANAVWGMNSRGDFVGTGRPSAGIERAFLYTDEGGLQDLELLIDRALGLRLLYAHDINDAGQIVGIAWSNPLESWRGYRLTPTTPVGPLAALAITPVSVAAGSTPAGWVTLTAAAPPGGAAVTLTSGDPEIVSVPGVVTVAGGERHVQFVATTMPVAGNTLVEVTAQYDGGARSAIVEVTPSTGTGIGDRHLDVPVVRVESPIPNPLSQSAQIRFELSQPSDVRLAIYGVNGRLVRSLVDSPRGPGVHLVVWDGRDNAGGEVPSGVYFYRMEAGRFRHSGKLALVR